MENNDWKTNAAEPEEATYEGPTTVASGSIVTWTGTEFAEAVGTDAGEYFAHMLLTSMETWSSTPEDHRAETPARFVNMLRQMTTRDPEFKFTTFDHEGPSEMITLGPIPFYTLCAHHVVPFFGSAWIGYVPDRKIVGLSKIPRTVKWLAKGFWVQETLTTEIADYLEDRLDPLGVAVVLEAEHMCMAMRGVEVAGVTTRTAAMRGVFSDHSRTAKAEFMEGIRK
jgi:GTP cyclohydrolase I